MAIFEQTRQILFKDFMTPFIPIKEIECNDIHVSIGRLLFKKSNIILRLQSFELN